MLMVSGIQIKSIVKVAKLVKTTSPGQGFINQDLIRDLELQSVHAHTEITLASSLKFIVFYSNTAIAGYQETHTTVQETLCTLSWLSSDNLFLHVFTAFIHYFQENYCPCTASGIHLLGY